MYYLPVVGAVANAFSVIFQRIILVKKKVDIKSFQVTAFLAATLLFLPFVYFFFHVSPEALTTTNIILFLVVILFSIVANLALFYSIKGEKISSLEPAFALEPLFTVILAVIASFFFEGLFDRNLNIVIPAFIAGIALVLSHVKRHHLRFDNYFIAAIVASFFFASELVVSKFILDYYTPLTFYFLRCLGVFLVSLLIFRPKFSGINNKIRLEILGIAFLWISFRVIVYYGYLNLGVVFTTLIVMLAPIFTYFLAWWILKEKIRWQDIVTSLIIIACVVYAVLI
ncbi:EamA-like transporter family protein [uncultured archaeon]|nr:EamA-like transporter family protein [uncultured archaeon]